MRAWLAEVRHDIVKHPLWRARDLALAGRARPEDLVALRRGVLEIPDGEGAMVTLGARWRRLREEVPEAPPGAAADRARALDAFGAAVDEAERAAGRLAAHPEKWRDAALTILRLDDAFAKLARELNPTPQT